MDLTNARSPWGAHAFRLKLRVRFGMQCSQREILRHEENWFVKIQHFAPEPSIPQPSSWVSGTSPVNPTERLL